MKNQRKHIWIDRFQTLISCRILGYFVLYQFAVWSLVIVNREITANLADMLGEDAAHNIFRILSLIVIAIGLLFAWDAIRFTHRIVGPLYRFRKVIQAIIAGEEMSPVNLRKGDFLMEMRDDFNEMLKVLEQRGAITLKTGKEKEAPAGAV